MKRLIFLILVIFLGNLLTGCGKEEKGGGGGASHIPDTTPHEYTMVAMANANPGDGLNHTATMRQICDNGNANFRDEIQDYVFTTSFPGGIGCGGGVGAVNVIFTLLNTGNTALLVTVTIDGVNQPSTWVQPGQTFNFSRGY